MYEERERDKGEEHASCRNRKAWACVGRCSKKKLVCVCVCVCDFNAHNRCSGQDFKYLL